MLVPRLLLQSEFVGSIFGAEQLSLAGEERVEGKDCYVIDVSAVEGMDLKLWVDKSSYLILRAFDRMPNATMKFQPKCDVKIAESEFRFSRPR